MRSSCTFIVYFKSCIRSCLTSSVLISLSHVASLTRATFFFQPPLSRRVEFIAQQQHSWCSFSYSVTACWQWWRWLTGSQVVCSSPWPFQSTLYWTLPSSKTRLPTIPLTGNSFVIFTWFAASRVFQPAFLSWIQSLHSAMPRRDMAFLAPCSVHLKCLMISFRVWLLAVDSTSQV